MMLTVGSLFAGIGGIELGLERTKGFGVVWQVEIDPYASRVLAKHWPDVARFRDVRDCGSRNLARVDLICAGFPCQPVSSAGRRRGKEDERWLWPEAARIVRELRPRYVLLENVAGLLRRGMGDVLGDLAACGYDAEWQSLPAAAFGAPHIRERVFILAYPTGSSAGRLPFGTDAAQPLPAECSEDVAYPDERGCRTPKAPVLTGWNSAEYGGWWDIEPPVGRLAARIPNRVDRLRCLGNAVVPQIAEYIGRCILAAERQARVAIMASSRP